MTFSRIQEIKPFESISKSAYKASDGLQLSAGSLRIPIRSILTHPKVVYHDLLVQLFSPGFVVLLPFFLHCRGLGGARRGHEVGETGYQRFSLGSHFVSLSLVNPMRFLIVCLLAQHPMIDLFSAKRQLSFQAAIPNGKGSRHE